MKPAPQQIQSLCPDIDGELIREHLRRLNEEYFERFDLKQVAAHLQCLSRLSARHPAEVILKQGAGGMLECTVLAFDYPAEFSLIAGILFGTGVNITSGDVFTYEKAPAEPAPRRRRWRVLPRSRKSSGRRRIIDHFWGTLGADSAWDKWMAAFKKHLEDVILLLEAGDGASISKAKHHVNEMVTRRLIELQIPEQPVLLPVDIEIDNDSGASTRLRVVSQDTPAFLYAMSNALSLHGLSIQRVQIRTRQGRIEDEFDLVDAGDRPVTDPELLDQIKLSVLLTKQCTYFLDKAPAPYTALTRFEQLVERIVRLPESGQWLQTLSDPRTMKDLARVLGASDYLWEDFIRLQYETLLPILAPHVGGQRVREPTSTLEERLREALEGAATLAEQRERVNKFKDREIFLLDLDHILNQETDFREFAERLTRLAEVVIQAAAKCIHAHLVECYGIPRTVGGLEASYAIFGLGKLGGAALGYASDIELLLVYSDNGNTDGDPSMTNAEFYGALIREISHFIQAKREGIFSVDLRLRPHGNSGPLGCSLENFCHYYGPGGPAHPFEHLALVRLREVAGDPELGAQVHRLRDEYVYSSQSIDVDKLHELRKRQFEEKRRPHAYNAKFSPGALVDIEYTVQILQVLFAKDVGHLRTPRIHEALEGLRIAGVLSADESERLSTAYDFLRRLINGLRMLRGSAKDLFLPPVDSDEFVHLARRMGYQRRGVLSPAEELHLEFETHTAAVRTFVERHFGRTSLPDPQMGNVADLVLSADPSPQLRDTVLTGAGFKDTARAFKILEALAGRGLDGIMFARLAVLALDKLGREPSPDMAINNWERFVRSLDSPKDHYKELLSQPKRLEILLGIFSRSQFLADTLIRNPDFYDWVTTPSNLHDVPKRGVLKRDLRYLASDSSTHDEWLNRMRRFRQRELLRIGTRDMFLGVHTREVMVELTTLAEALLHVTLEEAWKKLEEDGHIPAGNDLASRFCILAFGKLGGSELNYSSDLDLIGVHEDAAEGSSASAEKNPFAMVMAQVRSDLSSHTVEGHAYRVDLRLRPYGRGGELVSSVSRLVDYYAEVARIWEIQALIKVRPVAGNLQVGYDLLERLYPRLLTEHSAEEVTLSIQTLREEAIRNMQTRSMGSSTDVKNGPGGIRDVEFLVQGLQLIHASKHPGLMKANTMQALEALRDEAILPSEVAEQLTEDYVFLRRVEHYLQILHDRQIHSLPKDEDELKALARRMLGESGSSDDFVNLLDACLQRVYRAHVRYLFDREAPPGGVSPPLAAGSDVV